jgi:hypothetical protein
VRSPWGLTGLRRLCLMRNPLGPAGRPALLRSPVLGCEIIVDEDDGVTP